MDTADLLEPEAGEDGRSASELATLLVELGRVVKARRFYAPRDPKLAQVFMRGLRAWQVDLERHGPLEIALVRGAFRAARSGAEVAGHQLGGLAEDFAARELRRARFEPGLDAEAFAGFVELLATEPREVARAGGCARLLYARVPAGIVVNGTPPSIDPLAEAPPAAEGVASAGAAEASSPAGGREAREPASAAEAAQPAGAEEVPRSTGHAAEPASAAGPAPAAREEPSASGPAAEPPQEEATPPLSPAPAEVPGSAEPDDVELDDDELGELVFADDGAEEASESPPGAEAPEAAGEREAPARAEPAPEEALPLERTGEAEEPELDFASAGAELAGPSEATDGVAPEAAAGEEPELDFDFGDLSGPEEPHASSRPGTGAAPAPEARSAAGGRGAPADEEELRFAEDAGPEASGEDSDTLELAEGGPERTPGPGPEEAAPELELAAPAPQEASPPRTEAPPRRPRSPARAAAPKPPGGAPADALEAAPLEAAPSDESATELVECLHELEECEDAGSYGDLARRATVLGERLSEEGLPEEGYRALLVFARHASGEAKRASGIAKLADEHLRSLAVGRRLEDLIERACAPRGSSSVRATQVLLQLGETAVPPLLDAAELERDPDRRGQMHGILIAMGEKTLPELLRVMDGDDPSYVKSAVRIAGETQNPGAVPKLESLLSHEDAGIRDEAARSLVRVGDRNAIDALVKALASQVPGVPGLAAYCLGVSGSPRAVRPLLAALKEAANAGRVELAREMIRALGRLGRPEATPDLAELLLQRGLFKRRRLRELKVAAASALGRLPGDDAVGALAQAVQSRDQQIRRAAQIALDRRARSLAGR